MDLRINEPDAGYLLEELLETLGIRRLMFNNHSQSAILDHRHAEIVNNNKALARWNRIKNDAIAEGLQALLSDCSIIEFADWAAVNDASGFWDRLYCDVIKPLNRRDFQFIFHIGDTTKKLVFEVDEILDIMGDYSSYGTVTLVLHEDEADKLLNRLNVQNARGSISEKYRFLFNTIRIDVLLILQDNHTTSTITEAAQKL